MPRAKQSKLVKELLKEYKTGHQLVDAIRKGKKTFTINGVTYYIERVVPAN